MKGPTQRDAMRKFLVEFGYDQRRVCAAYAAAERMGEIHRKSNSEGISPHAYAAALWNDGHKARDRWILAFCIRQGIET
jgi:hypothetical protein